jgi:hypothetical protein
MDYKKSVSHRHGSFLIAEFAARRETNIDSHAIPMPMEESLRN